MKLSDERIKSLQVLLKADTGREYTAEQAQDSGMAIIRFVVAKAQRRQELLKLKENGNGKRTNRSVA